MTPTRPLLARSRRLMALLELLAQMRMLRSCISRPSPLCVPPCQLTLPSIFGSGSFVCSHVAIPAHHNGLRRYTNPSPSKPCRSSACIKPYTRGSELVTSVSRSARCSAGVGGVGGLEGRWRRRTFFVMAKLVPMIRVVSDAAYRGIVGSGAHTDC